MALVIPEGYASVIHSLRWLSDPEPMAVTYGLQLPVPGPFTAQEVADGCAQAVVDNLLTHTTNQVSLFSTEVRLQIDPPPADPVLAVSVITGTGADVGGICPQNTSYLFHKRTEVGGRSGRGRLYWPGVGEADVDNLGNVTGTQIGQWNTVLATFLTDLEAIAGGGGGMNVLHDSLGAYAAADPYIVTSLTCDPVVSTQRRRLRR